MSTLVVASPVGQIEFVTDERLIYRVNLYSQKAVAQPSTEFEQQIVKQVNEYFSRHRRTFDLPVAWETTPFRKKVCQALTAIPYGQTRTYGEVAKHLQSSPRAVGGACRDNPFPLLFPCHRVVAMSGLGGFSGQTKGERLAVKEYLLQHELAKVQESGGNQL